MTRPPRTINWALCPRMITPIMIGSCDGPSDRGTTRHRWTVIQPPPLLYPTEGETLLTYTAGSHPHIWVVPFSGIMLQGKYEKLNPEYRYILLDTAETYLFVSVLAFRKYKNYGCYD
ncbi:hypothetical protein AVEN_42531-1 [Araneus ventricosus]|uniref:Uncharacterized protein n=1 Tax=Araneus ventricosus TaxID=182803 RepID=A0A4Y2JNB6_ARAVE|nr:hypothetical protein AVEN_42531-1 [Araneus ventricosus]